MSSKTASVPDEKKTFSRKELGKLTITEPKEEDIIEIVDVGDVKGEPEEEVTLSLFNQFSEEFVQKVMNGVLDIDYLRKLYPQLSEDELRKTLMEFQEYSSSLDDPSKTYTKEEIAGFMKNEPGSKKMNHLIQGRKEMRDSRLVSVIPCNLIDCSNNVILERPDEHCQLGADPMSFFCSECQDLVREIQGS